MSLPPFGHKEIRRACGEAAFQKGLNYCKNNRVLGIKYEKIKNQTIIFSMVDGSSNHVYTQAIEFTILRNEIIIDGDCSCPVGYNCKHTAATLFEVLERDAMENDDTPQATTENWLERLKTATTKVYEPKTEVYKNTPLRLIYILQPQTDPTGSTILQVIPKKTRHLKKGGYGKCTFYSLHHIEFDFNRAAFIQETDKAIARLLRSDRESPLFGYGLRKEESYNLQGDFGDLALRKMLATGRCHWGDQNEAFLVAGASRELHFSWVNKGDGKQLQWQTTPSSTLAFQLEQLWYFDSERLECGHLEHQELLPEQMALLMCAPMVPEQELEKVSRSLLLDLPEYSVPTPTEIEITQINIQDTKPTIHLLLKSLNRLAEHGGNQFHCAQLIFDYKGIQLDLDPHSRPISQVTEENTIFRIHRDSNAEQKASETLDKLGLISTIYPTGSNDTIWIWPIISLSDSATHWHELLTEDIPQLREAGWQVEIDESFQLRFFEANEWEAKIESEGSDWFSLSLGVDINGKRINLLPILLEILSMAGDADLLRKQLQETSHIMAPVDEHHWLKLPTERMLPIFDTLIELYDHEPLNNDGQMEFSRLQGIQFGKLLNDPNLTWHGADELKQLHKQLSDFQGIQAVTPPTGFQAELRDYQQQGLSWIQFLREFEFNGILADDMGLGKTVQALAHLLLEKQSGRMTQPTLIIAPTSLMGNWRREAYRFSPELKVLVLHGHDRHAHFDLITKHDIILTTYPLLRRDKQELLKHLFHYIILDEAQFIKNPKSQTAQVVFKLKATHRLCLTGTPMENHLGELWSMFHFLMPGFLGNLDRFNRLFRTPIEQNNDDIRREQLQHRLKPFLLRRTKGEVAAELPEKTEIICSVTLEGKQRDLYESIRLAMDKKVRQEISNKGLSRSHIMILDALLKLRQVCCDPRLLSLPQAGKVQQSAKLDLLMTMLPEMVEEGRKILIFSQFTKMLGLIENELETHNISYSKLTGQTRKRDQAITRFQDGEVPVFLISLKAGGVGLNLTTADTVIHYDPWWNPAVETQATDRAHRIGQNKAVFVYKLIAEETLEEKILEMQKGKKALAESIYSGKRKGTGITADELTDLFKPLG